MTERTRDGDYDECDAIAGPFSAKSAVDGHALALAIAKLAGLHECPNAPNAVCGCAAGWCLNKTTREEAADV